jgi:hypothetical protein
VNEASGRRHSARLWRIAGGIVAGLLILAALLLGALRLAVARVPEYAERIQGWIERQTELRVEFTGLDARLRWYGPEIVLHGVRVLDRDGTQALFETREGTVALDAWNLFRSGELVAGRIRFVGPAVTVVRLADGRIRLLGQRERPADRPPFDLDRLPAGRVEIEDATVTYRDLKTGRGPWTLEKLSLSLQRDRDHVNATGSARLPASLGTALDFEGRLRGALGRFAELDARVELRAERLLLPGLADFLPLQVARPLAGEAGQGDRERIAPARPGASDDRPRGRCIAASTPHVAARRGSRDFRALSRTRCVAAQPVGAGQDCSGSPGEPAAARGTLPGPGRGFPAATCR